jgi:hypothetical protein
MASVEQMNLLKYFWLLAFVLTLAMTATSQTDYQELQLVKLAALRHVDNYGIKIDLSNEREIKDMTSLFTEDATHVNDVLPNNGLFDGSLDISYYHAVLSNYVEVADNTVKIRVEPFDLNYVDSSLRNVIVNNRETTRVEHKVEVSAFKDIVCDTDIGLSYVEKLEVKLTVVVWQALDYDGLEFYQAKIQSVELLKPDINPFDYVVLAKSDLGNFELKCEDDLLIDENESYLLYKTFDNAMIFENLKSDVDDILLKDEELSPELLAKKLGAKDQKNKRWGYELNYAILFDQGSTAESVDADILASMSKSQNWSVGFNLNGKIGSNLNSVFRFGVGYSKMTSTLSMDFQEIKQQATDPDGYEYERQTFINELSEEASLDVFMPYLGFNISKPLGSKKQIEIGLDVSGCYGILNSASYNSNASLFHQGYYEDLYGITIDEEYIYDFGAYQGDGEGEWGNLNSVWRVQVGPLVKQRLGQGISVQFKGLVAFQMIGFEASSDESWHEGTTQLNSLDRHVTSIRSYFFVPELSLVFKPESKKLFCQ